MLIYKNEIPLPLRLHTLLNIIFYFNKIFLSICRFWFGEIKTERKKKPKVAIFNLVRLCRISGFIFAKWKPTFTVNGILS